MKIQNVRLLMNYFLLTLTSYLIVKFLFRPIAIANGYNYFTEVIVFSYPNFCESIIGGMVAVLLLQFAGEWLLRQYNFGLFRNQNQIYLIAVLITGIYVILQECNIHNLGGYNTMCSIDIIFSLLGLISVYLLLLRIKPSVQIK